MASSSPQISRRRLLQVGGIGALGLSLPRLLQAAQQPKRNSKSSERSCIFIVQYGGCSHIDSLDPKPDAPQEIRGAYTEIVKDYDAGTLETNCATWKTGGSDNEGTMAWIAATCDCKDSLKGKARTYALNVSATVEKQDGAWKFVSLHMSNSPTPPPPAK